MFIMSRVVLFLFASLSSSWAVANSVQGSGMSGMFSADIFNVSQNTAGANPGNTVGSLQPFNNEKFVLITNDAPGNNVAVNAGVDPYLLSRGKATRQSSTAYNGESGRAVDGNTDGKYFGSNSVTHTDTETRPWWEVDLDEVTSIDSVKIYNRTDCCDDRLSDYYVFISEAPFNDDSLFTLLERSDVHSYFHDGRSPRVKELSDLRRAGRYLRIQLADGSSPQNLSLAEVEVFGKNTVSHIDENNLQSGSISADIKLRSRDVLKNITNITLDDPTRTDQHQLQQEWRYTDSWDIYYRINLDGDVECATTDYKVCLTQQASGNAVPQISQDSMVCKQNGYGTVSGGGYADTSHWCSIFQQTHRLYAEDGKTAFALGIESQDGVDYREFLMSNYALDGASSHQMNFNAMFDNTQSAIDFSVVLGANPEAIKFPPFSSSSRMTEFGITDSLAKGDVMTVSFDFAPSNLNRTSKIEVAVNGEPVRRLEVSKAFIEQSRIKVQTDDPRYAANELVSIPISISLIGGVLKVNLGNTLSAGEGGDLAESQAIILPLKAHIKKGFYGNMVSYGFTQRFASVKNQVFLRTLQIASLDQVDINLVNNDDVAPVSVDLPFLQSPPGSDESGVKERYWKPSYVRGVGTISDLQCGTDEEKDGGLCYEKPRDGYTCIGPVCWEICPGASVDVGITCEGVYANGVGTVPSLQCDADKELNGLLCYPKCSDQYTGIGPVCWEKSLPWHSVFHAWDYSYGRAVGQVASLVCEPGKENIAGLCYPVCQPGYFNVGGSICTQGTYLKKTYVRGVGSIPTSCDNGKDYDGGLCYAQNERADYECTGPVCWKKCDAGYVDGGAICAVSLGDAVFGEYGQIYEELIALSNKANKTASDYFQLKNLTLRALFIPNVFRSGVNSVLKTKIPKELLLNQGMSSDDADNFLVATGLFQGIAAQVNPLFHPLEKLTLPIELGIDVSNKIKDLTQNEQLIALIKDLANGEIKPAFEKLINASNFILLDYLTQLSEIDDSTELGDAFTENQNYPLVADDLNSMLAPYGYKAVVEDMFFKNGKGESDDSEVRLLKKFKEMVKSDPDKYTKVRSAEQQSSTPIARNFKNEYEVVSADTLLADNEHYKAFKEKLEMLTGAEETICSQSQAKTTYSIFDDEFETLSDCLGHARVMKADFIEKFVPYVFDAEQISDQHRDVYLQSISEVLHTKDANEIRLAERSDLGGRFSATVSDDADARIFFSKEIVENYDGKYLKLNTQMKALADKQFADMYMEEFGHLVDWTFQKRIKTQMLGSLAETKGDEGLRFRHALQQKKLNWTKDVDLPTGWMEDTLVYDVAATTSTDNDTVSQVHIESFSSLGLFNDMLSTAQGAWAPFGFFINLVKLSVDGLDIGPGQLKSRYAIRLAFDPPLVSKTNYVYKNNQTGDEQSFYQLKGLATLAFVQIFHIHFSGSNFYAMPFHTVRRFAVQWTTYVDKDGLAHISENKDENFYLSNVTYGSLGAVTYESKSLDKVAGLSALNKPLAKIFRFSSFFEIMFGVTITEKWKLSKGAAFINELIAIHQTVGVTSFILAETGFHLVTKGRYLSKPITGFGNLSSALFGNVTDAALAASTKYRSDVEDVSPWISLTIPMTTELFIKNNYSQGYTGQQAKDRYAQKRDKYYEQLSRPDVDQNPKTAKRVKKLNNLIKKGPDVTRFNLNIAEGEFWWWIFLDMNTRANRNAPADATRELRFATSKGAVYYDPPTPSYTKQTVAEAAENDWGVDVYQKCIRNNFRSLHATIGPDESAVFARTCKEQGLPLETNFPEVAPIGAGLHLWQVLVDDDGDGGDDDSRDDSLSLHRTSGHYTRAQFDALMQNSAELDRLFDQYKVIDVHIANGFWTGNIYLPTDVPADSQFRFLRTSQWDVILHVNGSVITAGSNVDMVYTFTNGRWVVGGEIPVDIIKIDFSKAGDGDGGDLSDWNQIDSANGIGAGSVKRYGDGAVIPGVSIRLNNFISGRFNNEGASGNWPRTASDPYYILAADDIYYHNNVVAGQVVIEGLDSSRRYNVRIYSLISNSGQQTDVWQVAHRQGVSESSQTRAERWNGNGTVFSNISPDLSGDLTIITPTGSFPLNAIVVEPR